VDRLLSFEPALADGIFPNGFFSGKLGFVGLLRVVVTGFGASWTAVLAARAIFALLCVAAACAAAGLWRALWPDRRGDAVLFAAVVLASPVVLYLGFKTLSEVPALLFVTASCWALAAALTPQGSVRGRPLVAAVVLLSLGTLSRVTAPVGFVSFAAALPLLAERRFTARRAWGWASVVLVAHGVVVVLAYALAGVTLERLQGLAVSVTGRTHNVGVAVYALGLSVQSMGVVAALGLRWPLSPRQRFALAWGAIGAAPYLLSASYLEPRFFYLLSPPLAMLAFDGLERLAAWTTAHPRGRAAACAAILAAVTVVNRAALVPLMTFELDERAYDRTLAALERAVPGGTVFVPWLSDYCYLALSRPGTAVVMTFSRTYGSGRVFSTPEFRAWAGESHYAGTPGEVEWRPAPWKYVGWTYNPTVLRVRQRLETLGLASAVSPGKMGLLDHLTASWLWSHPRFVFTRVPGTGPYQAFVVRLAADGATDRENGVRR
jgi:hypothetical protein